MDTPPARRRQAGIAAIELSITLLILFMLLFGIVTYGALFWAQQSLTAVAADTARFGVRQSYLDNPSGAPAGGLPYETRLRDFACDTAAHIAVLRAFLGRSDSGSIVCGGHFAHTEMSTPPAEDGDPSSSHRQLAITLTVATDRWPLLNTLRTLAALPCGLLSCDPAEWVPTRLRAHAVVLIAPTPGD